MAIKGPYFGYHLESGLEDTPNNVIFGIGIGTIIKIQEKPICRIMRGPCFGHKRAIFWPFLGKGARG